MKPQFVNKKIGITMRSGQKHVGILKRILDEEIVLLVKGKDGEQDNEFALYKDHIEGWMSMDGESIVETHLFVIRCSRSGCKGRIAYTKDDSDKEEKVACEHYDSTMCSVVAGDFYKMSPKTQIGVLDDVRVDLRSPGEPTPAEEMGKKVKSTKKGKK